MTENIYTETVTPEELSGEHLGLMARAQSTRGMSTYTSEGPITDIAFSTEIINSRMRACGATVKIGKEWWDLKSVRFHYSATEICARRVPDNHDEQTVTIDRETYNILVATYKTYQQIGQVIGAMGETPKLKPEDVATLDQA